MADRSDTRAVYTVAEAAALLGIGKSTLYDAIGRGEVEHVRIGKRVIIPRWWLDQKLGTVSAVPLGAVL